MSDPVPSSTRPHHPRPRKIPDRRQGVPVDAEHQAQQVAAALQRLRPDLARTVQRGVGGSLLLPLPGGRGVEIGRLRHHGRLRWVVVAPRPTAPRCSTEITGRPEVEIRTAAGSERLARLAIELWERAALTVVADGSPAAWMRLDTRGGRVGA
ncbi:hypothetical protein JSY14_11040 [Brachybacterium sp. EF45031]|uniref:hypothetical protein n=1 Tax=Brachybacterium sillae TaxID=2810536 RepID=UPI00217D8883|nr:hypothetical protein [Brachybacterium sillae]MCS6712523.1 hypothetical protein [Brachybacterium sillae]